MKCVYGYSVTLKHWRLLISLLPERISDGHAFYPL